ncbi:AAA family ATPase [Labedella endophytica]|uniref:AAA family ATPase n=1 Tax=Labedella endophytica TaxID=1523160 RepID=A0A3S0XNJ2_9MICO|nr:AAA family ATPase [Labedella endophytica]RUR01421.1 AAA family ATPase [Labedella endophytica]
MTGELTGEDLLDAEERALHLVRTSPRPPREWAAELDENLSRAGVPTDDADAMLRGWLGDDYADRIGNRKSVRAFLRSSAVELVRETYDRPHLVSELAEVQKHVILTNPSRPFHAVSRKKLEAIAADAVATVRDEFAAEHPGIPAPSFDLPDPRLATLGPDAVREVERLDMIDRAKAFRRERDAPVRRSFADLVLDTDRLDELPDPEWIVHEVIPKDGLAALLGRTGVGKTFVALSLAYHVAIGRPFMGRKVEQGSVLWIAAEGGRSISTRTKALVEAWKKPIPSGSMRFYPQPATFDDSSLMEELIAYVGETRPSLVVFDTWHRSLGSIQENDATDNGRALSVFDRMRAAAPGLTVLVLHHPNEQGEWRGSKSMPAALDTSLLLTEDSSGELTLEAKKQRDAETGTLAHLKLVPMFGSAVVEGRVPSSTPLAELAVTANTAYDVLVDQFGSIGANRTEWKAAAAEAGMSERSAYRAISQLVNAKSVELRGTRFWPTSPPPTGDPLVLDDPQPNPTTKRKKS